MAKDRRIKVSVYFTERAVGWLHTACYRKGLSTSAYVRYCVLQELQREFPNGVLDSMADDVLPGQAVLLPEAE
jgi:hypothetical protein